MIILTTWYILDLSFPKIWVYIEKWEIYPFLCLKWDSLDILKPGELWTRCNFSYKQTSEWSNELANLREAGSNAPNTGIWYCTILNVCVLVSLACKKRKDAKLCLCLDSSKRMFWNILYFPMYFSMVVV